jgi:hypothetical protein
MRAKLISRCAVLLACMAVPLACAAQVMQNPGTLPDGQRARFPRRHLQDQDGTPAVPSTQQPAAPTAQPAATAAASPAAGPAEHAPTAPSLLDKPPQPARIVLAAGQLSVSADNSSLTDILHGLAASSGMKIDGLGPDQRVFGTYGPGNPREILSSLLDGAGYNVIMIGDSTAGTPLDLILTQRNNTPVSTAQPNAYAQQDNDDQDDVPLNVNPPAGEPVQTPRTPGPANAPQNPSNNFRNPQQMLQEMQQMRQQQMQQQQQQQDNPQ